MLCSQGTAPGTGTASGDPFHFSTTVRTTTPLAPKTTMAGRHDRKRPLGNIKKPMLGYEAKRQCVVECMDMFLDALT